MADAEFEHSLVQQAQLRKPTLISIVIPTYNAAATLGEQLDALAMQTFVGDIEVIVSDNGSTDNLTDAVTEHPLARLRIVDSSDEKGASHARNIGAARAEGDFLAFCDADDRVHPGWLDALVRAAGEFDAVTGPYETTSINSADVASWRPIRPPNQREETPGFLPAALGGNLAMWRNVFERVGGFDETLPVGEDVDIAWRIQLAGFTLGHVPDAVVAYRLRDSYKALWRQSFSYGRVGPTLYQRYRHNGLKPTQPLPLIGYLAGIVVRNPLVPRKISRLSTGGWIFYVALIAGRIVGSFEQRTYYL